MNWSNKWDDKTNPSTDINWSNDKPKVFDTPKPFGQVMKEFNEEADKSIKSINLNTYEIDLANYLDIENREIELRIPEGWNDVIVKAIQIGDLAVVTSENEHCIAHVPTQTWFDNAIPDGSYTVEQYCLWAWKVQQTDRIYFKELAKYNNLNYKTIDKAMLANLQHYCTSIPVG